jgi:hypothetical protein
LLQPAAVLFRTPALYRTTACFYHSFEEGEKVPVQSFVFSSFFNLSGFAVKKICGSGLALPLNALPTNALQ